MKTLSIDIVSDVVCPWCYVGKRRLEAALQLWADQHPDITPLVHWHAFQLNPEMPAVGIARADYVKQKFGDRADSMHERLQAVGAEVGIPFAFERIQQQPNTVIAHSLIAAAGAGPAQDQLVEALFRSYFVDGRDLTRRDELIAIAEGAGMSRELAEQACDDEGLHDQTRASDEAARASGVSGVPFFIFNRRFAVSGAQDPRTLFEAMEKAAEADAT